LISIKKNINFIQLRIENHEPNFGKVRLCTDSITKSLHSLIFYVLLSFSCLISFSSCVPSKNLKANQYLLYQQNISGNKHISTEKLEVFYRQKPNRKILYLPFSPYLYAYYQGLTHFEKQKPKYEKRLKNTELKYSQKIKAVTGSSKKNLKRKQSLEKKLKQKEKKLKYRIENGNFMMTTIGEAPAILDSIDMEETRSQMQLFLNKKGYFEAKVVVKTDSSKKKVSVKYTVEEGQAYRIDKITYEIEDKKVKELIEADSSQCLFKKQEIYDEQKIIAERERINNFLRNNGYFDFNKRYIYFNIDSNKTESYLLDVQIFIENPPTKNKHKIYRIDSIRVFIDTPKNSNPKINQYEDIFYFTNKKHYSQKILDSKIHLRPDTLFSHQEARETQRSLGSINMFKFINFRYDTTGGSITTDILLKSYPKYNISVEGGVSVTQALPGPFFSLGVQNRNVFNGSEILSLQVRGLVEAQSNLTNQDDNSLSQTYNINLSLRFPQFIFPMDKNTHQKLGKFNPQTQLRLTYAAIDRTEYNRINVQALMGYNWSNRKNSSYRLDVFNLNLSRTKKISPSFKEYIEELFEQGSTLLYSFSSSLVGSISGSHTYNDNRYGAKKKSKYLRLYAETGGSVLNPTLGDFAVSLVDSLPVFPYMKYDIDLRRYRPSSKNGVIATRLHVGLAYPFSKKGFQGALPYEKYFFIGGSSSLRAWSPRRLGPGSFSPDTLSNGSFDYRFEQSGELLLEASIEARKKLFSYVEGAIFMDIGNIWMLNSDGRTGGQFEIKNFWKEFAVGVGVGLRLDLSFLIIRADLGIKAIDPARELKERFILDNLSLKKPLGEKGQSIFNIAVGYPF
jgi:outer membrane protein assembly factor BamA